MNNRIKIVFIFSLLNLGLSGFTQKATPQDTTVYVFLSEACPICQNYTLTLKQLDIKYKSKHIRIVGVFPNYYSTQKSVDEFKKKYAVPFDLILDKKGELTKHFKASITPEVFVESPTKKLLYSGRIDDTFYALGKRRQVITSTELADAIEEIISGKPIKISKTQAVGCIITTSK
ncbi:hypothetical protein BH10BAC1_BH10BAC1_00330 [soil metagenome]